MRSVIWYLGVLATVLATIPKMLTLEAKRKKMSHAEQITFGYGVAAWAARRLFSAAGGTVEVIGAENVPQNDTVLFVCNHQSYLDFIILLGYIPREKGFIAKVELEKIPILRYWMREIRCVFMDRADIRKAAQAILDGIKELKAGRCMVIFPEGTCNKGGAVLPFKAGSFKLATKARVPIIPVSLDGTADMLEKNGYRIKPRRVRVVIHPPVETAGLSPEATAGAQGAPLLSEQVRETIIAGMTSADAS